MKPTHGPAPLIIAQAIELGLLCRPIHSPRVGVGEALEVSKECFWLRNGHDHERPVFSPSPSELMQTWELTTMDLLRSEWDRATGVPW